MAGAVEGQAILERWLRIRVHSKPHIRFTIKKEFSRSKSCTYCLKKSPVVSQGQIWCNDETAPGGRARARPWPITSRRHPSPMGVASRPRAGAFHLNFVQSKRGKTTEASSRRISSMSVAKRANSGAPNRGPAQDTAPSSAMFSIYHRRFFLCLLHVFYLFGTRDRDRGMNMREQASRPALPDKARERRNTRDFSGPFLYLSSR